MRNLTKSAIAYGTALFLAVCTFKLLQTIHGPNIADLADVAFGVTEGTPRGIAFQNRLLGPWLVRLMSETGISFESALWRFHFVFLALQCVLLVGLLRRSGLKTHHALAQLVVFLFMFLVLQFYWYHTWDILDMILFTLVAYGAFQAKGILYFTMIFAVALLNRESSLFVALFLMLDSVTVDAQKRRWVLDAPRKLAVGAMLLVLGLAFTVLVRQLTLVEATDIPDETRQMILGNELHLAQNLRDLLVNNLLSINIIYTVFILGSFAVFLGQFRRLSASGVKCLILALLIFANIMVFGIIIETRMLLILLPLFLFLWNDLQRGRAKTEPGISGI